MGSKLEAAVKLREELSTVMAGRFSLWSTQAAASLIERNREREPFASPKPFHKIADA